MNIRKTLYLFIAFTLLLFFKASSQNNNIYIQRDVFTKVINVSPIANHGDDIININVFYKVGKKIEWSTVNRIISYTYLGVDNQNNLHIQTRETKSDLSTSNIYNLVFALDSNKSGDITLIGERSQRQPLLIKIHVEANNDFIKIKYLGDLPVYQE